MEVNRDALDLFQAVETQWRGAGFGLIGLDYNVLYLEAERMGIELTTCNMGKIRAIERDYLMRARPKKPDGGKGGKQ